MKMEFKKIYLRSIFPHLPILKTYICLDDIAQMFDIDQIQILAPMSQIMSSHTNIVMHSEKGLYMFFFYKQSSFYFLIIIVILICLLICWTDSIWQAKKLCILRTYSRQIFKIDCFAWSRMKIIRRGFHQYIKKKKKMEGAQWTVKYSTCIDVLRRNKNSQEHWPQFFMCWV